METVLGLSAQERDELFSDAAQRLGFAPVIVEKDFWACWVLRQLFEWPELADHLIFKGGTSLSKIWNAIRRFSEDLDVSVERAYLGFGGEQDPANARSNTQRRQQLEALNAACGERIASFVLTGLRERAQRALGSEDWEVCVSPDDPLTLLFRYPTTADKAVRGAYVRREVRIEFGARSADWPAEERSLQPYVAEAHPDGMPDAKVSLHVLSAERTYWEKATILHAEAHRPEDKLTPTRYSRHYADLAALARHQIGRCALPRNDIRESVVKHKTVYFASGWARYDLAVPGSFRLVPDQKRLSDLEKDYRDMHEMFFEEPPKWTEIVVQLRELERVINASGQ